MRPPPFFMATNKETPFRVTQKMVLRRGIRNRCPNCGSKSLFRRGLTINERCSRCGMSFERGEGFFLGSMSINYTVTLFAFLVPVLLLGLFEVFSAKVTIGLAIAGAILFPIIFYRSSRSWWLMAYFYFLPHELPANRRDASPHEDEA